MEVPVAWTVQCSVCPGCITVVAFSTFCNHGVNTLLLVPLNILIEFNVDYCNVCFWRPKIWLCKDPIKSDLLEDCVITVFTWLLLVLGVFLTVWGELQWLIRQWCVLLLCNLNSTSMLNFYTFMVFSNLYSTLFL